MLRLMIALKIENLLYGRYATLGLSLTLMKVCKLDTLYYSHYSHKKTMAQKD